MSRGIERVAPEAVEALRRVALPLGDEAKAFDALIERMGDARFVLLGESTHGTHEFYALRARLTQRLVAEHGFRAVAIEGDWPDAYRVNRWIRGRAGGEAREALDGFRRFPTWMWRNVDVLALVAWLREHGATRPAAERAGFYGLDLYSLYASMEAVLRYLDEVDPAGARRARDRYACFEPYRDDAQAYGYSTAFGTTPSCEEHVLRQLREMRERASEHVLHDGRFTPDDHFHAEQNARIVSHAEEYYRAMFRGRVLSWNLRDSHMIETLAALDGHLAATGPSPVRIVVWAHNSHVGDARATELGSSGEWNLGQLARERFPGQTFLVGFTTFHGTVTAATDWDQPARRFAVRPALPGSYESLLHAVDARDFLFFPRRNPPLPPEPLLQRAIGVVYRPQTERASHYFEAHLARQFDAVFHVDRTRAVEPLDRAAPWDAGEPPETSPSGL